MWPQAEVLRHEEGYFLGPHTDIPTKVATLLFNLPGDASAPHLGTTLYEPLDPAVRSVGSRHHDFGDFRVVRTMPFVPNSVFGFLKTDNSFHGVAPISAKDADASRRDLIQYTIYNDPALEPRGTVARQE